MTARWALPLVLTTVGISGCGAAEYDAALYEQRAAEYAVPADYHKPSSKGAVTAYIGATVVDPSLSPNVQQATVLVRGQAVAVIAPDATLPEAADIVDLSGKWVVPGFIDAHIHFMTSGRPSSRPAMVDMTDQIPYPEEVRFTERKLADTLGSYLCSGVTGVLSAGGPASLEYRARHLAAQSALAPTVFIAHGHLSAMPAVVAQTFFPPINGEPTIKSALTRSGAEAFAATGVRLQADAIKTVYDSSMGTIPALLQMNYQSMHEGLVAVARANKMTVTAHLYQVEPTKALMRIGINSVQHTPIDQPIDEEFVQIAKDQQVIVVPTVAMYLRSFKNLFTGEVSLLPIEKACGDADVIASILDTDNIPPPQDDRMQTLAARRDRLNENVAKLARAGVELAVGTDVGVFGLIHGPSFHLELRDMAALGIAPLELLKMATINGARVAGKSHAYGSLETGKFADFVVLDADPLQAVANWQNIHAVSARGIYQTQNVLTK